MDPYELAMWGNSCVSWLVSIAIIVVGVAVIRPANPTAGMIVIAAGAVDLLVGCCSAGATQVGDRMLSANAEAFAALAACQTLAEIAGDIVLWGGLAAAAFVMARALRALVTGVTL